jgi:hypothetical protein
MKASSTTKVQRLQHGLPLFLGLWMVGIFPGCDSGLQHGKELDERIERRFERPEIRSSDKHFAFLINGDRAGHHKDNIARAYQSLLALGYNDQDIFILSAGSPRQSAQTNAITAKATRENVRRIMEGLSRIVTTNDSVLIYCSGHGDRVDGKNVIVLADGHMRDADFVQWINTLESSVTVVANDGCLTGSIPNLLRASPRNVIAFSITDESSETCCMKFSEKFWQAPFDLRLDQNGDGAVSIREAFDHAMSAHRKAYPMYDSRGVFVSSGEQTDAYFKR